MESENAEQFEAEKRGIVEHLNAMLKDEENLSSYLPVNPSGNELFDKVKDGILLCHLMNVIKPDVIMKNKINEKNPNVFKIVENHNLALNAAKEIGLHIINIGANDLSSGNPKLVLAILWQAVKYDVSKNISTTLHPELNELKIESETATHFNNINPLDLLMRWINYHLEQANSSRRITNYTSDLKDGVIYYTLLHHLNPIDFPAKLFDTPKDRLEYIIASMSKAGLSMNIYPEDIIKGVETQNILFCTMIFDHFPYLRKGLIVDNTPKVVWKEGNRNNNINKICKNCHKIIQPYEDMTLIRDYYYHDQCFNCIVCHKSLINQTFRIENNNLYCSEDYYKNFGLKCYECNEIIKGKYIKLGNEHFYHDTCYCCYDCKTPFGKSPCYTMNINENGIVTSRNFCEKHYRLRNIKTCKKCNQPIIGDCVTYKTDYYHSECFTCCICHCMLIGPSYLENNGLFYCVKDYPNPQVCFECGTRIFHDPVVGLGKYYHKCCFKCSDCKRPFRGDYFLLNVSTHQGNVVKEESLVLCQEDYQKRQGIVD